MKKASSMFVCQECGYESSSWYGKCPECGNWNSLKEVQSLKFSGKSQTLGIKKEIEITPKRLDQITSTEKERITTGFSEMDNVLGGGLVKGSVTLLAGDPGIGKSTLLLQTGLNIASGSTGRLLHVVNDARNGLVGDSNLLASELAPFSRSDMHLSRKFKSPPRQKENEKNFESSPRQNVVLYISGEESEEQIKLRANRITNGKSSQNFLLLSLTNTDAIVSVIEKIKPSLVIIDSIQTMESENTSGLAGFVPQIRFAAFSFIKMAKALGVPVIMVGHVTKEGMVAGPMMLSHMVDTVLFLEGEKLTRTRILRSLKNRFGPVDEVGIFEMEGQGMSELKDTEKLFLSSKKTHAPGSILVAIMEGTRPFLIEIQTLTVFSKLPYPRRVASGIDAKRLELLLAILQKHCHLPMDSMDVFVNVAGGIKVSDPASDLGICMSLFSSLKNISLPKTVGVAEVGLLGELRQVPFLDKRIKEAKKLGFDKIVSAQTHKYLNDVIVSLGKK
ncbi:MAG: DNA repair protein RadA [Patescibacteria group bacterium]|nr:DNA repair protein RadA [Patescibacteria group bacterium]